MATAGGKQRFVAELSRWRRVNLDTNILIYYLEDEPRRSELVNGLFRMVFGGSLEAVISAVVQMELLVKAIKTGDPDRAQRVIELTDLLGVVAVSPSVATQAAVVRAAGLQVADALVLATGIVAECDATLTNDRRWERALAALERWPSITGSHVDSGSHLLLYLDDFLKS